MDLTLGARAAPGAKLNKCEVSAASVYVASAAAVLNLIFLVFGSGFWLPYDVGPARAFLGEAEKTPWPCIAALHRGSTPLGK